MIESNDYADRRDEPTSNADVFNASVYKKRKPINSIFGSGRAVTQRNRNQ